jgi:hypothetical protein
VTEPGLKDVIVGGSAAGAGVFEPEHPTRKARGLRAMKMRSVRWAWVRRNAFILDPFDWRLNWNLRRFTENRAVCEDLGSRDEEENGISSNLFP